MLTLDVLIATFKPEGIRRVEAMDLPVVDGVRYVVSWQNHDDAPVPASLASRSDVVVSRLALSGQSYNRNNAFDVSTADIRLIADDDLRYSAESLNAVRRVFEQNPDLDYASFMFDGDCRKTYPTAECDLRERLPKNFYQTAFEVAVRNRGLASKLRFHTDFGINSPTFHAGEDEIFLLTARKLQLNCRFFPIVITTHKGLTTGRRKITDPCILRTFGAIIYFNTPLTCLPRIVLKALRLSAAGQSGFFTSLVEMLRGLVIAATRITPPWKEVGQ